jgi:predicted ATPase
MEKHQLDWISIEGFKSIANSGKIELRPINLVIGANGVGKSNFLDAFELINSNAQKNSLLDVYVERNGGADNLLHFGAKHTQGLTLKLALKPDIRWEATFTVKTNDGLQQSSLQFIGGDLVTRRFVKNWNPFNLQDSSKLSPLRKTNKTDDNDYLRPDGSNLAAFLYRLQIRFPNDYKMIVKTVQRIAPFFEDFLLRPDNLNPEFIKLAWTHKGTDKYFGASSLSDGTLRFIALTTLLMQPLELRPSVILIDEPELGLHPEAIGLLASLIKLASVDTQIIAATQSPALLDHFEPEDVLVAERVNGGTVFNRLNSEKLQIWLEDYSLGQLWEKNEIGGNPLPETRT